jgi:selenocysteine-specific elongation factor
MQSMVKQAAGIREIGGLLVDARVIDQIAQRALTGVREFHRTHPEAPGISIETLRRSLKASSPITQAVLGASIREGKLTSREGIVALSGFVPKLVATPELVASLLAHLDAAGLEPPTVSELETQLSRTGLLPVLRRMASDGQVIPVEADRFFSTSAAGTFVAKVRELAVAEPVTPAKIRDSLGISRKYVIPLLEWADRSGVTQRVGDTRVLKLGSDSI